MVIGKNFLNILNKKSVKRNIKNKVAAHPKQALYDTLKSTYELRKSQLDNMNDNDPDKKLLKNELENLEGKLDDMKTKYQFEHLKTFENFQTSNKKRLTNKEIEDSI